MSNEFKGSSKGSRLERTRRGLLISSRVIAAFMSFVFCVALVGSSIAYANEAQVSSFLKQDFINKIELDDDEAEDGDYEYFKSDFESVAEVRDAGAAITEEVSNEGIVLLKNGEGKDGKPVLPLDKSKDKISMFSAYSAKPIYSGARENNDKAGPTTDKIDLLTGLKNAGLTVNEELFNWYKKSKYGSYSASGSSLYLYTKISEAPWSEIDSSKTKAGFNTAMFVITRIAGEGTDCTARDLGEHGHDTKLNGNYLVLNNVEREVMRNIKLLKDSDTFDKFIVLMNTTNQVQLDFLDEFGVDAVLYCGGLAHRGANAVGNILAGNVNPSGKLSDTFWKNHDLNPTLTNWGPVSTTNGGDYTANLTFEYAGGGAWNNGHYVVYQEGIYSGYRYTETRYEDQVMGTENVGEFDYWDAVAYPFGYGLSYTTFEYSDFGATYNAKTDAYDVSVKVTNTGKVEGKNAVQVWLQKPYTEYDKTTGIEQAAVTLVDFGKTGKLKPNGHETVTVSVDKREFASYDSYGERTYILEKGNYYLTVAQDAHEAVNNILAAKGYAPTADNAMDAAGDAKLVKLVNDVTDDEYKKYSVSKAGTEVTNVFDDADILLYDDGKLIVGEFSYITRKNWAGTTLLAYDENRNYLNNYVKLKKTDTLSADMVKKVQPDNGKYPTMGAAVKYQLIDLRIDDNGQLVSFDDPKWDALLDSLTFDQMASILQSGLGFTGVINSISSPGTREQDSDVGVISSFNFAPRGLATKTNDKDKELRPAVYNDNGIVGATRNKELCRRYGEQWGEDCLWVGYNGLYGAGANIHRNPYLGRTYGYFSEDPMVTGLCVAEINLGMTSKGSYMLLKHCVLNEQESNRCGSSSWANEQSIREIYLKAFQVAIEKGQVQGVMTSLNRIGAVPAPHHNFINKCLRGEFGMRGYVVTDSWMGSYMDIVSCIVAGNDIPIWQVSGLGDCKTGYSEVAWAMRDSLHNILYTTVRSSAMNGISTNVRIFAFEPEWIHVLQDDVMPAVTAIAVICMVFLVAMEIWRFFWKPIPKSKYVKDKIVLKGGDIERYNNMILEQAGADRAGEAVDTAELDAARAELDEAHAELEAAKAELEALKSTAAAQNKPPKKKKSDA